MISVILNVYKRPYTLESQIKAILETGVVLPEDIHIWINTPENGEENVKNFEGLIIKRIKYLHGDIKVYKCSYNTKFWGRFTLPLLCKTPYIAMFDDDVICGKNWLKNCMNCINEEDGILGGSGIIVHGKGYRPNTVVGWNGAKSNGKTEVDLVGHAWFFKQETARAMWMEKPPSWDNGEDMFFSYAAQKYLGVKTYVPPHPDNDVEMWANVPDRDNQWGYDKNAHSLTQTNHIPLRNRIVSELIDKNWKTVKNVRK
jgi:hypothetical protein